MAAKQQSQPYIADATGPASDDAYWRTAYTGRPYYTKGTEYTYYKPAYSYGSQAYAKFGGKSFDAVESDLRQAWEGDATRASYKWDAAKPAVRDAYERTHARTLGAGQTVAIPVTEEELQVGKREVEGGGVRVRTAVSERPAEGKVNLREERVTVERRPANRPATDADFDKAAVAVEATAKREVAVAAKTARVVEEVVVGKAATERTETVRDTVRRTDVSVEKIEKADVIPTRKADAAQKKGR
jgi:uncharacterized protein (TIGR02271 family)